MCLLPSYSERICFCVSVNKATSGRGGWPMSVWLTPNLKPIVGGTYFPPDDRYYGQPGFKTILARISSAVCHFVIELSNSEHLSADVLKLLVLLKHL